MQRAHHLYRAAAGAHGGPGPSRRIDLRVGIEESTVARCQLQLTRFRYWIRVNNLPRLESVAHDPERVRARQLLVEWQRELRTKRAQRKNSGANRHCDPRSSAERVTCTALQRLPATIRVSYFGST